MEFAIPTVDRGTIRMIDYASACGTRDERSEFRTWLPRLAAAK